MSSIQAAAAIMALTAFLSGVPIGVILIASLASRREDRLHSLADAPPDAACDGTRQLIGAHTMRSGFRADRLRRGPDTENGCGYHGGPHGTETEW